MSSCAFAARMRHRVHQGSDCVYVCISTTWEVVETNVRFRASRGSRPHRDAWLPICDSSGDAVRTCRELATRCANFVVTYEKNPLPMHTLVDGALQNHILYHMLYLQR